MRGIGDVEGETAAESSGVDGIEPLRSGAEDISKENLPYMSSQSGISTASRFMAASDTTVSSSVVELAGDSMSELDELDEVEQDGEAGACRGEGGGGDGRV